MRDDIVIHELAYKLVQACEEVLEEGDDPSVDPAVMLIAARIGFVSPADSMSEKTWKRMIQVCEQEIDAKIELKPECLQ